MSVVLFSILAVGPALMLLAVLGLGADRRRLATLGGMLGVLVCLLVELADLGAWVWPDHWPAWKRLTLLGESLIPFGWMLYAAAFGRAGWRDTSFWARVALGTGLLLVPAAGWLPLPEVFFSPDFDEERMLFLGRSGFWFYLVLLLLLVPPLVQLERTLGRLADSDRWRVKFELVGAGVILAGFFIYSGQGLLYRSLDMNLLPVRSVGLLCGASLMVYSRLRRGGDAELHLSRQAAFGSLVILAVGIYLFGLGLAGEGMRYLGLPGQRAFLWSLALVAGTALVLVFLAEATRRRILVFLHKHFYRQKYDYREQWLNLTRRLAGAASADALQAGLLEAFVATFRVRGAALFLPEPDGSFSLVRAAGLSGCRELCPADHPLVAELQQKDWVIRLEAGGFREEAGLRLCPEASLGVPLYFEEKLVGMVLLGPRIHPWEKLTYEDFDLMKVFGRQGAAALANQRLTADLATAQEMAAMGKVATFVVHDLKNQVSGLSLVVDNARNYLDDPEFQKDMLETLDGTVANMNSLIARLRKLGERPNLQMQVLDLKEVATAAVRSVRNDRVRLEGGDVRVAGDRGELHKVVLNLLLNALEAGGSAPVRLQIGADPTPHLRVVDQGCGMSDEFIRQRLFKAFETTKKGGFGIGLYQVRQIVEAHRGHIEVQSRQGEGTTFTVWLPAMTIPREAMDG